MPAPNTRTAMVDFRQNPAHESESGTDTEVVVSDSTMAQYPAYRPSASGQHAAASSQPWPLRLSALAAVFSVVALGVAVASFTKAGSLDSAQSCACTTGDETPALASFQAVAEKQKAMSQQADELGLLVGGLGRRLQFQLQHQNQSTQSLVHELNELAAVVTDLTQSSVQRGTAYDTLAETVAATVAAQDEITIAFTQLNVTPEQLPSGTPVQLQTALMNDRYRVLCPAYANDLANFVATKIRIVITTVLANSKIFIRTQFAMRPETGQHYYVDIRRSKDDGSGDESMAAQVNGDHSVDAGNADTDGIMSGYPGVISSPTSAMWVDSPNVPKGTTLTYTVFVGLWTAGYMNIGAHSGVGINDNTPELMVAQEIAA